MLQAKVVEEITNFLCLIMLFFFLENTAGYEVMWENAVELGRLHGAYSLHAGYLRLQTHLQNMKHLLFFHPKNGCTNAPRYYIIRDVMLSLLLLRLQIMAMGTFWQGLCSFWFGSEWLNMICLLKYNYSF